MSFLRQIFLDFLKQAPDVKHFKLAYSGGLDSHLLLDEFSAILLHFPEYTLSVLHVNHGIQALNTAWETHCARIVYEKNLPYFSTALHLLQAGQDNLEERARMARYAYFASHIGPQDCLLTAHHMNDQMETFFLQAFRGAGPQGLCGLASYNHFSQGYLWRPLLSFSRDFLESEAKSRGLDFITDPSNFDEHYQRNFLRQIIVPQLKMRWPGLEKTISRATKLCAVEHQFLRKCLLEKLADYVNLANGLSLSALQKHSLDEQALIVRTWIGQYGFRLPNYRRLYGFLENLLFARPDRFPALTWGNVIIRRFQDALFIEKSQVKLDPNFEALWLDLATPFILPQELGKIIVNYPAFLSPEDKVHIRFRRGGEVIKLKDGHHHTVKKLYQSAGIPPWLRERIPFIYLNEKLIQIGSLWIDAHFAALLPKNHFLFSILKK